MIEQYIMCHIPKVKKQCPELNTRQCYQLLTEYLNRGFELDNWDEKAIEYIKDDCYD